MLNKGMFTSDSAEWETPKWLFDSYNMKYGFTLDPAATAENAKCETFFTKEDDGLAQSWFGHRVWLNPPYGREIKDWVKKAYSEGTSGAFVCCLLPARTDTAWFHDYCVFGKIDFIRGRLKFGDAKNSAPFPSMIVMF